LQFGEFLLFYKVAFVTLFEGLYMRSNASHNFDDFEPLLVTLQNTLGVVVPDEQRNALVERIIPLLSIYELDSLTELAKNLEGSQSDSIRLVVLDVVSQTQLSWALNAEVKHLLNDYVFSQLPDNARVWIIGCGKGQSAYAVVMEAAAYEYKNDTQKKLQFVATDVSATDIKYAESGIYDQQQMLGLSEDYKRLFTSPNGVTAEVQVKEKIRQNIRFIECDLMADFQSLGQMDLIICPEALAYFSNKVKAGILQQCSDLLKSGGIFLTGYNQIIMPSTSTLERVEHSAGIFYRQKS